MKKLVDKCHCNDMEPYLSTDVDESNNLQTSDDIEDLTLKSEDQHDFTIEKFLFYDEFLKNLYVISKMYDACSRSKELLNVRYME